MNKKVAIVFYGYPFGISTMIINTAKLFSKKGYAVDLIVNQRVSDYCPVYFPETNINIIPISDEISIYNDIKITKGRNSLLSKLMTKYVFTIRFLYYLLKPLLLHFPNLHFNLLNLCKPPFHEYLKKIKCFKTDSYKFIIGIEIFGLYAASMLKTTAQQKLIYFNMELFQLQSNESEDRYLKAAIESFALKKYTDFIALQNRERINVFLKNNLYIPSSRVVHLPVASLGEPFTQKGTYFREKFNIPKDKKIVLYAGNIIEWAMCLEIVKSVKYWNDQFVLVLHTYIENPVNIEYFKLIEKNIIPNRIFLSKKQFSFWKMDEILSSADIGLIFYRGKDENFTEIGFSSNKLTQYMKVCLPLITNDLPFFKSFFEENNCGICVSTTKEINIALEKINSDYEKYRENAYKMYNKYFNFQKYFDVFYSSINK